MAHLYVAISAHGFGHGAITVAVIHALRQRCPNLELTVRTDIPCSWLEQRLGGAFNSMSGDGTDFGMRMRNATVVDASASLRAHADLMHRRTELVTQEAALISAAQPDAVLSNVSYLIALAGKKVGVPVVGLAPFTWADIFARYCATSQEGQATLQFMIEAYAEMDLFIKPTPALPEILGPMNVKSVDPIGVVGINRRDEIMARLNLPKQTKLALLAFGGMDQGLPLSTWPVLNGWHWINGHQFSEPRADMSWGENLKIPFNDLIASSDVVVTKPGYGTFVEAGCAGTPVLTLPREDWPEWSPLMDWLSNRVPTLVLGTQHRIKEGQVRDALEHVSGHRGQGALTEGAEQAASLLAPYL
ncbi:MAG: hypothetical protein A2516_02415 [Alphaproteobacteria bacterium RIFOXYD12_FULL_60_8]|nr:MAG: hypothetical protein A2516_02415 [Alphaproteobacteria bacterium RIFOXYD12_FULL_60_8]